jgi:hypothetical protein
LLLLLAAAAAAVVVVVVVVVAAAAAAAAVIVRDIPRRFYRFQSPSNIQISYFNLKPICKGLNCLKYCRFSQNSLQSNAVGLHFKHGSSIWTSGD